MRKHTSWLTAAGLGFALPAVFPGLASLERDLYPLVYLPTAGAFCTACLFRDAPDGTVTALED